MKDAIECNYADKEVFERHGDACMHRSEKAFCPSVADVSKF
jgi:hypothetical protein